MYEVDENDLSCMIQENINSKELTLITCNNHTKNRIIVKARAIKANE